MYKHKARHLFMVSALVVSTKTMANGFALNEQSASGAGTAFAGRSSSALDSSTIFGNPAGLSKLKRTEVSGGLAVLFAKDDISAAQSSASGTNKGDSVPVTGVPFGYFSTPINEVISFGVGVYVPFGLINDYESNFQGRYHGSYSKVSVFTVQPTISYRINDKVSIGGGPTINRIGGKLESQLATGALNSGKEAKITLKGDDTAVGYNLGIMVDITEATTWGVTYHSKVDYKLEGHTKVSDSPAALGLNGKYDLEMDVTLPESVDTSFTHHFDDKWTGYVGTTWTRWSRLPEIVGENSGLPLLGERLGFGRISEELNFRDTWATAIGASYALTPQWVLRAGYVYDQSPTRNEDRNVRIPVGNRQTVTFGAGYSPYPDMTIDLAYAYLWEDTAGVNAKNDSGLQPAYTAKYDNSSHGLAAQLTYRF
ncbi:outer membrane protein transport protein [Pseudomonas sp. NY15435]|uniref:outer membrane protein transport protein n=1 Tax=Pseudomonas sp. NY15435 TaxID=3400358 RepID=UPI003A8B8BFA